jgi:type I restriction enzyme R subunit
MLTTGIDARNIRNIVLDRSIGSMVEFKQIIGRGTRIFEGKDYFTIIDFRGTTNKFYDDDWDGEPLPPEPKNPTDGEGGSGSDGDGGDLPPPEPPREKLTVKLGESRELRIIDVEIRYIDETGRPLSAQQFIERLMQKLPGLFASEEELREIWSDPDRREDFFQRLGKIGFDVEQLDTLRQMFSAEACDLFDLLNFLVFEQPMTTRHERAEATRLNGDFFNAYTQQRARDFLEFVLDRYEQTGERELSRDRMPSLIQLSGLGTTRDVSQAFGGRATQVLTAFRDLQQQLYHCA